MNQGIKKLMGNPKNLSAGSGGRSTEAERRPKEDGAAKLWDGNKCTMYGTEGVPTPGGVGGKRSQRHKSAVESGGNP